MSTSPAAAPTSNNSQQPISSNNNPIPNNEKDKSGSSNKIETVNPPVVAKSSSPNNTEKISYKVALIKEANTEKNSTKTGPKDTNQNGEPIKSTTASNQSLDEQQQPKENKKIIENQQQAQEGQNENTPSYASSESFRGKGGAPRGTRSNYNMSGKSSGPAWKKNIPKKKRREDDQSVEVLADPTAWPSLDQTSNGTKPEQTNASTDRKTKEGSHSEETILSPRSEQQGEVNEQNQIDGSQNAKKKGVNWVPFHGIEATHPPRQYSNRGRGGMGRGGRRDVHQQPNQAPNPSYRGRRGGGRGGYSRGGYTNAPGTIYYQVDTESLRAAVLKQIEYYFSIDNLCKDLYLRGLMDEEGWIPISQLTQFNRLKTLTTDAKLIAETVESSKVVECKDEKLRKREDWKVWLIPSKVNETQTLPLSPTSSSILDTTNLNYLTTNPNYTNFEKPFEIYEKPQYSHQANNFYNHYPRSYHQIPISTEGRPERDNFASTRFKKKVSQLWSIKKIPSGDIKESHVSQKYEDDLDDISNLIIVTQSSASFDWIHKGKQVSRDLASVINEGLFYTKQTVLGSNLAPSTVEGTTSTSSNVTIANSLDQAEASSGLTKHSDDSLPIGWMLREYSPKEPTCFKQIHSSYGLLEEKGFRIEEYSNYRARCLYDRKTQGIGKSKEMNTLYRFWTHFLQTHFNRDMYQEFKAFSLEDAKRKFRYGIECLFRFFSYGLENKFRTDIFENFQGLVLEDYANGSLYGLEKFWALLQYRKHSHPLPIRSHIQQLLGVYKTLEDFRR